MNCLGTALLRHFEDSGSVQVTLARGGATNAKSLVTGLDMQRLTIGRRIHRNAANAKPPRRPGNAKRNFTAIGDQNFAEHYFALIHDC
jgi:hypothetical protein